jgi:crotonobetainyl-CoA:carnitine CoA-transferase CaiB-like acyl-CoA transferase
MPFAPIGKPEELFDDPHLNEGGLEPVTLDDGRQTRLPTIPLELAGGRPGAPQTLARPGEHSRAVLAALGYDEAQIAALMASGAVEESL